MNWPRRMRHLRRWLSMAITLAVVATLAALGGQDRAFWVGLPAVLPLALLLFTGLYPCVLPHLGERARREGER
jgi:hypothetical protein